MIKPVKKVNEKKIIKTKIEDKKSKEIKEDKEKKEEKKYDIFQNPEFIKGQKAMDNLKKFFEENNFD